MISRGKRVSGHAARRSMRRKTESPKRPGYFGVAFRHGKKGSAALLCQLTIGRILLSELDDQIVDNFYQSFFCSFGQKSEVVAVQ